MAHAGWIIDLGAGADHNGIQIVFEGTPTELVTARSTLTGKHLEAFVGASRGVSHLALSRAANATPTQGEQGDE